MRRRRARVGLRARVAVVAAAVRSPSADSSRRPSGVARAGVVALVERRADDRVGADAAAGAVALSVCVQRLPSLQPRAVRAWRVRAHARPRAAGAGVVALVERRADDRVAADAGAGAVHCRSACRGCRRCTPCRPRSAGSSTCPCPGCRCRRRGTGRAACRRPGSPPTHVPAPLHCRSACRRCRRCSRCRRRSAGSSTRPCRDCTSPRRGTGRAACRSPGCRRRTCRRRCTGRSACRRCRRCRRSRSARSGFEQTPAVHVPASWH